MSTGSTEQGHRLHTTQDPECSLLKSILKTQYRVPSDSA